MSHLQTSERLKIHCQTTGDCKEYLSHLKYEDNKIDAYTADANQTALTWGVLVGLIGLLFLLTPFIKTFNRIQQFVLPKLAVASPILIGLVIGVIIGFVVTFSACFKQPCSGVESSAVFTLPALSLLVTIPLARKVNMRRQNIQERVGYLKPKAWIVIGLVIILFSFIRTTGTISDNNQYRIYSKNELRGIEGE